MQRVKNEVFGHFLQLGASDWLEIAYVNRNKLCAWVGHPITQAGSFKNRKNAFLNDPNSQKQDFWSFSWVGCITFTSYCIFWQKLMVCMICPSNDRCWIIQNSKNCLFEWSKQPKTWFLAIFMSLVQRINLILHILIELSCVRFGHRINDAEPSKNNKMFFWMILN